MTPEKVEALGLATFEDLPASPSASYGKMTPSPSTPVRPTETGPFVFTEVLPLVPAKLANKIRRGEYINMSELLKDNMAVERRWAASPSSSGQMRADRTRWLHCYSLYAAITQTRCGKCGHIRQR